MSKSKKILSFLVGLMCGLACLVSGLSVGGARPLTAHAATDANGVAVASLAGYNATTKKYNYVYFGEYPQTRVLEVLPDWYNFPVFSERSMKVENEIKGYIAELNKTYYSTYLADAGNKYHAYYDPNYNWETTNVLRYIPMEDYANDKIAFDYKTAYYTLLVDVYSDNSKTFGYPAGTKFYPYNYAFDSYIKLGATYTVDPLNPTYTYVNGPRWDMPLDSPLGYITIAGASEYFSMKIDEKLVVGTAYTQNDIQLLIVEPIKWRVLVNQSGKITLMSEKILDYSPFNLSSNYLNQSFTYSILRSYLNDYNNQRVNYNSNNYQTTYFSSSNWSFIDRAFSLSQVDKILETEIVDDKNYMYFDDVIHIYTQDALNTLKSNGTISNGVVELNKPKSNVKIFIPTNELISNDSIYGLNTNETRIAFNTDYSVVSGNADSEIRGDTRSRTKYSTGSGYYLVIAGATTRGYFGNIGNGGVYPSGYPSYNAVGVRPCFCINESDLLSSGGVIASDIIDLSVNENGTLAHPVNLERTSTNAEMTYYAFTEAPAVSHSANYLMKPTANGAHYEAVETLATPLDNPAEHNGTWEFVTTHANGANFEHVIKVVYNGQAVGEKLVARVKNSAGKIIAMNVVGMVGASGNGETYFKFLHNSGELNYTVDVFTLAGTTLTQTNILFAKNGEVEKLSTIYLDPQGLYGGSDVNLGTTADTPLKTLDYAKSRLDTNGTVHLMSTIELTEDYTFDLNGGTLKRWFGSSSNKFMGIMVKADGTASKSIKVVFKNITIDGNKGQVGDNTDASVSPIKCTYTDIFTETGSAFINHSMTYGDTTHCGGVFYLATGCSIVINDVCIKDNYTHVGAIYSNSGNNISINGGLFVGNYGGTASLMMVSGSAVVINGGCIGVEGKPNSAGTGPIIQFSSCDVIINNCDFGFNSLGFNNSEAGGSAIYAFGGTLQIKGGYFHDNYASGGGVRSPLFGFRGVYANINNACFENNSMVSGPLGSVLYVEHDATINISNSTFINNSSKVGSCVFINCRSGYTCPVTITNCTFRNNKATGSYTYTDGKARDSGTNSTVSGGGAIYCTQPLTVTNCTFDGNEATARQPSCSGGAMVVTSGSSSIKDCKFINNKAGGSGGACSGRSSASVTNCLFEGNSCEYYGGAINYLTNVSNCRFIRNQTEGRGGAIYSNGTITKCEFLQNCAGSGICGAANVTYKECIFEENCTGTSLLDPVYGVSVLNCRIINNCYTKQGSCAIGVSSNTTQLSIGGDNIIYGNRTGAETHVVDGLTLPVIEDGHLVGGTESNILIGSENVNPIYYNTAMFSANTKIGIASASPAHINGSTPLVKTNNASYYMGSEALDCFFCDDPDYELEYRDVLKADGTHDYYGLFMKKKDATKGVVSGSDLIDFAAGEFIDTGILLDWTNGWELGFNFIADSSSAVCLNAYTDGGSNGFYLRKTSSTIYIGAASTYSTGATISSTDLNKPFYAQIVFDPTTKVVKMNLSGNGKTYTAEYNNTGAVGFGGANIKIGSTNSIFAGHPAGTAPVQCALTYVKNGSTYVDLGHADVPSYTASDFRGIYDGEDHGIDVATHTSGATVTYSTDGVTYSASKPKYNKAGTYTTYFKVSASGKRTVMGTRQVVIQQPKTVKVGTVDLVTAFGTKFAVGDDVTNLIKATIHDEHGNAVDGKFTVRTAINSVAFTTTSINLTFTPTNPIYQTCNLSATVKIEYENLYYYSGNFYTDADHTQGAIPIATKNISTILEYMKNGGTIYFLSTYETSSALTLSTSKQVNLKRGANFRDAILQVKSSTLQIGTTTMAGQITLDGASIDGQMALIVNKGTLKMYGNVVVQNAYNTQGNASNLGGALYNTGTATIDIVKITKIRCANGGTIHNTGTLTLSNTLITDSYSSIGGAGVYTSNKATISNVSFKNIYGWTYASNVPKGFALHIAEGTATVRNCSVQNVNCVNSSLSALSDSSYTSTMLGGGAYVAPTATLNISSTTFYTCKAYNGAGIYVEGTMVASHVTVQKSTATNFGAGLGTSNTAKVTLLEMRVISSTAKTSANETAGIYVADNAQVITMAGADVEQTTADVGLYLALAVCALVAIASAVIVCAGKKRNK